MKVAFDARPAAEARGIGRYTSCLLDALRAEAAERDATLIETHKPKRHVDCFHSPWIDGALLRPQVPTVVTLHDLIPLKRRTEYLRSGLRFRMRYLAVKRATRVIVPTRAVAADATALLDLDPSIIDVIPEAPAAAFYPRPADEVAAARERHAIPDGDYLLWVGGLRHPDPRKRIRELAAAPRDLPLVLVGGYAEWAHELPDVTLTGAVSDGDLAALYSGARALVFPSDDEGFGLPPIEALACGTPVVASDVPVLREVLGDRATLVESSDLAGLLHAAVTAPPAPDGAAPWSWRQAAASTWRAYERAASARS